MESEVESAQKTIAQMKTQIEYLEEQKQLQADEYSTLALSCTQFEQKLLRSEEENRHILAQLVKCKQDTADKINSANEEESR